MLPCKLPIYFLATAVVLTLELFFDEQPEHDTNLVKLHDTDHMGECHDTY